MLCLRLPSSCCGSSRALGSGEGMDMDRVGQMVEQMLAEQGRLLVGILPVPQRMRLRSCQSQRARQRRGLAGT